MLVVVLEGLILVPNTKERVVVEGVVVVGVVVDGVVVVGAVPRVVVEGVVLGVVGNSRLLPLLGKIFGTMPLFLNYIGACSCFDTR